MSKEVGAYDPAIFAKRGYPQGGFVPDFVLYDTAGAPCRLGKLLAEGKPVLLIAISYTCSPTRRHIIGILDSIKNTYAGKINVRIIYTLEAHPITDACPYTGVCFTGNANYQDSILVRQPQTYLQRKNLAAGMIREMKIPFPVLIDSPQNDWWKNFGPAPDNAYLLSPEGIIYKKYGWFVGSSVFSDIAALLKDKEMMSTDFEKDFSVCKPKSGGDIIYFKKQQAFSFEVFNASGKRVLKEEYNPMPSYDLDKLPIAGGEYSLVIKTADGHPHCLRFHKTELPSHN